MRGAPVRPLRWRWDRRSGAKRPSGGRRGSAAGSRDLDIRTPHIEVHLDVSYSTIIRSHFQQIRSQLRFLKHMLFWTPKCAALTNICPNPRLEMHVHAANAGLRCGFVGQWTANSHGLMWGEGHQKSGRPDGAAFDEPFSTTDFAGPSIAIPGIPGTPWPKTVMLLSMCVLYCVANIKHKK